MKIFIKKTDYYCVKSVRIWSYPGPYSPTFGLYTERYGVSQNHFILEVPAN